jgi:hypothetical protein
MMRSKEISSVEWQLKTQRMSQAQGTDGEGGFFRVAIVRERQIEFFLCGIRATREEPWVGSSRSAYVRVPLSFRGVSYKVEYRVL